MPDQNTIIGQVKNLADLIQYQEGAVVSRTLMDKPAGTVTLFAFDREQGLSEHTAPFDAMVYVIENQAEITVAGEVHTVKQGEMLIMPANIPHSLKAQQKFKMMLIMVKDTNVTN